VLLLIGILYAVSIIIYLNALWIKRTFPMPVSRRDPWRPGDWNTEQINETNQSRNTIISPHWE
jgi:hypothetical protein